LGYRAPMNLATRASTKPDLQSLVRAIQENASGEGFAPRFTTSQWDLLANYLQPFELPQGRVLIDQNANDRTVYLVESGSLSVHFEDSKGRLRLALVGPGSAVGEGSFFTRHPRSATVQAASACKLWTLSPIRFTELATRHPAVALEIAMALGALVSRRLMNKPRRVAVT
jgi:CRP-like cAMP-binding protein